MNIRRVLAVAAIPFMIGTFGFVAPNQANAEAHSPRTQIAQQQRIDKKPQVKHRQPSPQQKKRHPQPHHQNADRNQVRPNNR